MTALIPFPQANDAKPGGLPSFQVDAFDERDERVVATRISLSIASSWRPSDWPEADANHLDTRYIHTSDGYFVLTYEIECEDARCLTDLSQYHRNTIRKLFTTIVRRHSSAT